MLKGKNKIKSMEMDDVIFEGDDESLTMERRSSQKEKGSVRSYRGTISQSYHGRSTETRFVTWGLC
jgi:hypothetical protein